MTIAVQKRIRTVECINLPNTATDDCSQSVAKCDRLTVPTTDPISAPRGGAHGARGPDCALPGDEAASAAIARYSRDVARRTRGVRFGRLGRRREAVDLDAQPQQIVLHRAIDDRLNVALPCEGDR
jgi:hypothetical protein